MNQRRNRFLLVGTCLLLALWPAATSAQDKKQKTWDREPEMKIDPAKVYVARIDTTAGPIVAELYPKLAPHHVNSFVFLAREGFYDGVIFHRVIPNFMIQGGDPTGTGAGGPGYELKAEFNDTRHTPGILSAARTADPDSAGSQFFIMHGTAPSLDGKYTVFGKVTQGMEVVEKIVTADRDGRDRPANPTKINSIKIEEKGGAKESEKAPKK
jgi:cyclophilin family peptidyl-prolyl cis-trans isomerase